MKIAVVGAGAIGAYWGAALHRGGAEVHLRHSAGIGSPTGSAPGMSGSLASARYCVEH